MSWAPLVLMFAAAQVDTAESILGQALRGKRDGWWEFKEGPPLTRS